MIFLNDRLIHLSLSENDRCSFCQQEKETTQHLFYDCAVTETIWDALRQYCTEKYKILFELSYEKVILNDIIDTPEHFINLLVCITKQHLYAYKCSKKKANAKTVINELEFIHKKERNQTEKGYKTKRYNKSWPDGIEKTNN